MRTKLKVEGFHCGSCEALVKDVAGDFTEITSCEVDVAKGIVVLEHEESFNIQSFIDEIESLGEYKVVR